MSYRWRAKPRLYAAQILANRENARQRLLEQLEAELAGIRHDMNLRANAHAHAVTVRDLQIRHGDTPEKCLERLRDLDDAANGRARGRAPGETWAEIQHLTRSGCQIPEIARRLGVTESTVLAHFHRRGLKPPYPVPYSREYA